MLAPTPIYYGPPMTRMQPPPMQQMPHYSHYAVPFYDAILWCNDGNTTGQRLFSHCNECILQHLPNMTRLTLCNTNNSPVHSFDFTTIKNIKYPNFEYFACHTNDLLSAEGIRAFLETNPKIKSFSLQTATLLQIQQYCQYLIPYTGGNFH